MVKQPLARWAALLLTSLLVACAATQVPPDNNPAADEKNGVVVFSVSHDLAGGTRNNAIVYLDGGLLGGRNGAMYQSSEKLFMDIAKDSEYPDVHGHLYAVSLPAGDHEFTTWQISNGSGLRIFPSKDTLPQRFHVNAGEVTYLGSFHGNLMRGKNIFGITITANGVVSVDNEQTRDLELLYRRYPQYKCKVKIEILRRGLWTGAANTQSAIDPPLQVPAVKTK